MRVAYVANYQGPSLVSRRPCLHNFSLAARVKIQLLAELLVQASHDVELISQGQLEPQIGWDPKRLRIYPSYEEPQPFRPEIPVRYASAISVRFLTGFWESLQTQSLLRERHLHKPFDIVLLYNLQRAQLGAARCAIHELGLPVVLQYEDDAFVDVHGKPARGLAMAAHHRACRDLLSRVSGATGVTPYLLSQVTAKVPTLLLRGVVSREIQRLVEQPVEPRQNRVVFSGTHEGTQGLEQLVEAWRMLRPPDWQLHIAGHGPITQALQARASGDVSIVFHGLLDRAQNALLLCTAKIGMNPQDLTSTPGNVFAFKIVEYLAAGLHVITTPRGLLEQELEAGTSYIPDNTPKAIAASLALIIREQRYKRTAEDAAMQHYGADAVSRSFSSLLEEAAGTS